MLLPKEGYLVDTTTADYPAAFGERCDDDYGSFHRSPHLHPSEY